MANDWEIASEVTVDPMAHMKGLINRHVSILEQGKDSFSDPQLRSETHKLITAYPQLETEFVKTINQLQVGAPKGGGAQQQAAPASDQWDVVKEEPWGVVSEMPDDRTAVDKALGTGTTVGAILPYFGTKAVKGLTNWITPSLGAAGIETNRVLTEAEQYWRSRLPNLGSIPNVGIAPPPDKPGEMWPPTIERLPDTPIADILGATAEGAASIAGPVKGTLKAAEPIVKPLESVARPAFQRIAKGMVGGGLLGAAESADKPEEIPEKALESAGMFGAFEAVPGLRKIPGGIKTEIWPFAPKIIEKLKTRMIQSKAWRDLTPAKRVPVIQDFEETMRGLKKIRPDLTEVEIYQKFMKGNFMEDAINKFSRGESSSIFEDILETQKTKGVTPEPPIETAATGRVQQEVPEFTGMNGKNPLSREEWYARDWTKKEDRKTSQWIKDLDKAKTPEEQDIIQIRAVASGDKPAFWTNHTKEQAKIYETLAKENGLLSITEKVTGKILKDTDTGNPLDYQTVIVPKNAKPEIIKELLRIGNFPGEEHILRGELLGYLEPYKEPKSTRPLPATAKQPEPIELKKVPEEPKPIIGPEGQFVEGTGEIQYPYPGQRQLPGPIPLLPGPKKPKEPPSKPIPGPVGGSQAFFPEGAPINVPPQLQLPGPQGPLPMAGPPQQPPLPPEPPVQPKKPEPQAPVLPQEPTVKPQVPPQEPSVPQEPSAPVQEAGKRIYAEGTTPGEPGNYLMELADGRTLESGKALTWTHGDMLNVFGLTDKDIEGAKVGMVGDKGEDVWQEEKKPSPVPIKAEEPPAPVLPKAPEAKPPEAAKPLPIKKEEAKAPEAPKQVTQREAFDVLGSMFPGGRSGKWSLDEVNSIADKFVELGVMVRDPNGYSIPQANKERRQTAIDEIGRQIGESQKATTTPVDWDKVTKALTGELKPEGKAPEKAKDATPKVAEEVKPKEESKTPRKGTTLSAYPIEEVPIKSLNLSEEVPNFKEAANKQGVVEPLTGKKYERLGTGPIVVWQRANGKLEVITGRHRLDLAKRTGEKTIPAQIVKESDGFTKIMAFKFDAEANIRDNQGSVRDYANYFRNSELDKSEASSRGLLARNQGRVGFSIGKYASDNLYTGYRTNKISEAKTLAISEAAPENEQLQTLGIKYATTHDAEDTANYLRAIQTIVPESTAEQINLFGENESWQIEADKMARAASKMISELEQEKSALRASGKLGKDKFKTFIDKYGVNPGDQTAIAKRLTAIEKDLVAYSKWPTDPVLIKKIREAAGLKAKEELPAKKEEPIQKRKEEPKPAPQPIPIKKEEPKIEAKATPIPLPTSKEKPITTEKPSSEIERLEREIMDLNEEAMKIARSRFKPDMSKPDQVDKWQRMVELEMKRRGPKIQALQDRIDELKPKRVLPSETARELLSLPWEMQVAPWGDDNSALRVRIIEELTGKKLPKAKAGATAVRDALLDNAGIETKGKAPVEYEKELREWLKQRVRAGEDTQTINMFPELEEKPKEGFLSKLNKKLGDKGGASLEKKTPFSDIFKKKGEGLLDAIRSLQRPGQPRELVPISKLRDKANMPYEEFDKQLLQLAQDGKVALHHHDFPMSLKPEERAKLLSVKNPYNTYTNGIDYYVGVVPKTEPTGGGILSKERGEHGGADFKKKKKGVTKEDIERTDTTQLDLSTPAQIWETLKKGKLKLNAEDATILENIARIPLWVGKAHKQYKPIQDVIDDRFRDYHIIRNGYVKELLDSWEGLSDKSNKKLGDIFWKEDEIRKILSEKGKAKLTPEELRAYETKHAVMDFIWKEHLPDIYLQSRLGKRKWDELDEIEQDELKKEIQEIIDAGWWPGFMPHPRPGRYFAKASVPAKSEVRTRKGLPYKSESQLKEALRMRGLDPDKYNTIEVEDGWIARSKVEDTFDTVWREGFDDILTTITGKGRRVGIPSLSYKAPSIQTRLEKKFPEALIEIGENTRAFAEQGYFEVSPGVTQELVGAALKRMGPEATPEEIKRFGTALTEAVNEIFKVRGFMEHSMKRKGIPGFDKENWQEAVVNYVTGFAGFASKTIASRKLWDAWPKSGLAELPNLRKYAEKQVKDTFSNMDRADETIAKARALMFYDFLGGIVKSALIQPTGNFIVVGPRLTVDTKWADTKLAAEMAKAAKDVLDTIYSKATGVEVMPGLTRYQTEKAKRLSEGEQRMLRELREDGTISTQLTDELMGKIPRESFLYGVPEKVSRALRFLFGTMELYNRETTGVVAYRVGEQLGKTHEKAVDYARSIINEAHGKYGRTNLPPFARGEVGKWARLGYSFSFYPHNQLALYRDLGTNHGPRGKYGLMKAFMALMFFGGLGAIPFYKDLEKAAQKITGKNLRSEIAKITGDWSKGIFYGVPGMMGVDITGSIGISLPSQSSDLLGPPAQYAKRTSQFMNDVAIRDWQRAAEDFPLVFQLPRNVMAGYRQATRGVEKRSGKDVVDDDFEQVKLTKGEAVGKALGFQPVTLSETYRKQETRKNLTDFWNEKRNEIVTAAATHQDDEKQMERIEKLIDEFNETKPDFIAPIKGRTIKERILPIRNKQERLRREQVK